MCSSQLCQLRSLKTYSLPGRFGLFKTDNMLRPCMSLGIGNPAISRIVGARSITLAKPSWESLKRGLEKGIRRGLFREFNATLMTVMLLGLQDYNGYLAKALSERTLEELYDDAKDIILYGILKR